MRLTNENGLKRNFKILHAYIKGQSKIRKEIVEIENELDKLEWEINEQRTRIIYLYGKLGQLTRKYEQNNITIEYYRTRYLKEANLTG